MQPPGPVSEDLPFVMTFAGQAEAGDELYVRWRVTGGTP